MLVTGGTSMSKGPLQTPTDVQTAVSHILFLAH